MTDPLVSVVIPTRNRWSLLADGALRGALGQEDVELEGVVVDEASTDGTRDGLLALDDPRVRIVRHAAPRRLPGARNHGAEEARGTWLAFLDDDDLWAPDKLRAQLDTASGAGVGWVYGRAVVVDEARRVLEADPFPQPSDLPGLLLQGNWVPGGGSNVVVQADLFRRVGGFDESLRFFEDWDLWLRLLDVGLPGACDEVVMARVEHGDNMVVRDRLLVAEAYERLMSKRRPVTASDRRSLQEWLALEQHRAGRRLAAARLFLSVGVRHRSLGNLVAAAGAVLGERGLELTSRLLVAARGGSHLESRRSPPVEDPGWLEAYR